MAELLETVCAEFKDYAQARHKETNRVEAMKLVVDGAMNPRFGEYEMIQDPDLNKGVQYHCESIVEDFEDEILAYFSAHAEEDEETSKEVFCNQTTDICVDVKDEL
ncbi:UNVERIFIED_CONTAM: hypothetical protein GTU68_001956 [Idotea baltica]|nr:hypothetical protein [Idotea baltica]